MQRAYIPMIIAVAMAIGVWLGSGLTNPFQKGESASWTKIEQILQYVANDYVDTVSRAQLEEEIIAFLMQRLDPHSHYINQQDLAGVNEPLEGNFDGIGIQFNLRNDTIYVVSTIAGGPSEKAGLQAGDLIVLVNNDTVAGTGLNNISVTSLLKGPRGSTVDVSVKRKGNPKLISMQIERGEIPIKSIEAAYLLDDSTIFVKLARFSLNTYEEFQNEVYPLKTEKIKGFILDLRGNGGGFLDAAINLSDEFIESGALITYTEGRARPKQEFRATAKGEFEDVALTVLIDGFSASASEIVAGAVQDLKRGKVVGSRSFGKGLVQEQSEWSDGSATRLTVARYFTPNGRSIQRPYKEEMAFMQSPTDSMLGGILPDVVVGRDTAGITWLFAEAVHRGLLTQFAYDYRDRHLNQSNIKSEEVFLSAVSESAIAEAMYVYLKQALGSINDQEWQKSRERMALRAKALIGRSLFTEETYYKVYNNRDIFVQTAHAHLYHRGKNVLILP